jgi:nucleoside-diphosphate-sugar epimerase
MKFLVTGATGFVGSHLVKRLIKDNNDVRALVRKGRDTSKFDSRVEIVYGDITDPHSLDDATRSIDIVYHSAAIVREAGVPDSLFYEVNVKGTENLLEASLRHGVKRFIHISTGGVHGDIKNPPASEDSQIPPHPPLEKGGWGDLDIYQKTKIEGEKVVLSFKEKGLSVVIIRPTGVYGPGDLRLLKLFRLINRRRFFMVGDGMTLFHPVYIDDLIEGLILAGKIPEAEGEVFLIGGERYLTLNEIVRIIAGALNVPIKRVHLPVFPVRALATTIEFIFKPMRIEPPLFRRRVDFFTKNRAFDISKAKRLLGYQPKVDIEKGVRLTIDWYRREGLL